MARELAILITARNMASGVLKDVRGDIKGIQSEAKRGLARTAVNLGIMGVAAGGVLATQVHQGLVGLARLETIAAQTNAAIESTGGAAKVTAAEVRGQADEIERLTGIESESIQEGQNLLLTFTNLRNEVGEGNDIYNQATDTMVDMSHAMGQDASQTAIQLGKALQDPIRGVTALRRVGVQLTEAQEKSIKTFMEQGDIMSAQKVILEELNNQFGGSASAFGETAQGRLQKMQHAWGNLQEQLAIGVLPVLERVGATLTEMFNDPKAAQTAQDVGKAVGEGLEAAIDIATKLPWDAIGSTFGIMGQAAKTVLQMFSDLPPWVQTAVLTGWGLNALSGGALGNIVGALGSGLIKGVLGMNAGVVNINAGVVNGGPGAGPGAGGGGGRGGIWNVIKWLGPAAVATGANAVEPSTTQAGIDLHSVIFPDGNPFSGFSLNDLDWPFGNKNAPDWASFGPPQGPNGDVPTRDEGTLKAVHDANASEGRRFAGLTTAQRSAEAAARSSDAAMLGSLRVLQNKRTVFNPNVNVTANLHNTVVVSGQQTIYRLQSLRQSLNQGTSTEGFI